MPVLTTPRLLLRRFRPSDLEPLHELLSDPRAMQYSTGVMTRDLNDEVIGQVGLVPQRLGDGCEIELTYRLRPDHWGKGIGTEAARGLLQYGFDALAAERLVCFIDEGNTRSRLLAERVGMSLWRQIRRGGHPIDVYAAERS
jgi:RimJ/RimL family protein N-acetyltransferase